MASMGGIVEHIARITLMSENDRGQEDQRVAAKGLGQESPPETERATEKSTKKGPQGMRRMTGGQGNQTTKKKGGEKDRKHREGATEQRRGEPQMRWKKKKKKERVKKTRSREKDEETKMSDDRAGMHSILASLMC